MRILAFFQKFIVPAIPKIIAFLSDGSKYYTHVAIKSLATLSEHGNLKIPNLWICCSNFLTTILAAFGESITPAIPEIIALLNEDVSVVHAVAAESLAKFLEQGKILSLVSWHL